MERRLKPTRPGLLLAGCALGLMGLACGDDAPSDAGVEDGGPTDAEARDAGGLDASPSDAGHTEAYGFQIRVPTTLSVPCIGEAGSCEGGVIDFPERDFICTLRYQAIDAYLYIQARPTQYVEFMGPGFETVGAWLSDGITAEPVTASYDWGGGHHNEAIVLDLPTQRFQYWHSSFGFGFRACHPPDCLDVYEPGSADLVESGCSPERTLPVICVAVTESGEIPPLVDTFAKCPGDG